MKILDKRAYRHPNIYALYPVIRLTVDLGELDERFTDTLPGFNERLLAALPQLGEHGCSFGSPGGFVRRLGGGTLLGHVLEHVAIAVQNSAIEPPVSFGKTRSTGTPGEYHVVYATRDVDAGLEAADVAHQIVSGCLPDGGGCEVEALLADFCAAARRRRLGPSTAALVAAAEARDIPWRRLDQASLVELGTGRYARRLRATVTEQTGCIAVELAGDKQLAGQILREAGLPAPRSEVVTSVDQAIAAAERIGYPVVLKPVDGNHGRGVRVGLRDAADVSAGFHTARRAGPEILIQEQLEGADYRLLVVDGELIAAALRDPASVIGDGARDVEALVAEVNASPDRGEGHEAALTRIVIDDEARRVLALQGLDPGSVPRLGEIVRLSEIANLSRGGVARDVTDRVHPDNARAAERAARALRLDVAGVDLVVPDIAASWRETGGGICEVNAGPGFRMHLSPCYGRPRDVAARVIDALYPPGAPSAAPIAALTGTNGKTTTARMLAHIQRCAGRTVGLATSDGVYVDGELIASGDLTGPTGARMALADPRVDSAVLEVARGGILRAGLGFDRCDVGAVLNVGADHLGHSGVETLDDMAYVKAVVAEVATAAAVLDADDPRVAALARRCRARRIIWVSRDPDNPRVREHLAGGGAAVILDRDLGGLEVIDLVEGERTRRLAAAAEIPATLGGAAGFNVDNAMFAAALAHGCGIDAATIGAGLRGFACSFETTPGRLNVCDRHPFRVILDYCHNGDGFRALGDMIARLDIAGRRLVAFGLPGDRRDSELRAAARAAAACFDGFIIHDEDDRRGRAPLEVPELIAAALQDAGVDPGTVVIVPEGERAATELALRAARPGDLLIRLADGIGRAWRQIAGFDTGDPRAQISTG